MPFSFFSLQSGSPKMTSREKRKQRRANEKRERDARKEAKHQKNEMKNDRRKRDKKTKSIEIDDSNDSEHSREDGEITDNDDSDQSVVEILDSSDSESRLSDETHRAKFEGCPDDFVFVQNTFCLMKQCVCNFIRINCYFTYASRYCKKIPTVTSNCGARDEFTKTENWRIVSHHLQR